jgi:hypothetical protein
MRVYRGYRADRPAGRDERTLTALPTCNLKSHNWTTGDGRLRRQHIGGLPGEAGEGVPSAQDAGQGLIPTPGAGSWQNRKNPKNRKNHTNRRRRTRQNRRNRHNPYDAQGTYDTYDTSERQAEQFGEVGEVGEVGRVRRDRTTGCRRRAAGQTRRGVARGRGSA